MCFKLVFSCLPLCFQLSRLQQREKYFNWGRAGFILLLKKVLSASSYGHFTAASKYVGPNVIYFVLGITEGRPAGAFLADQIVF